MLPADVTYTFFMLVRTTPAWLRKPPRERFAFLGSLPKASTEECSPQP